jgi:hypothetical protein
MNMPDNYYIMNKQEIFSFYSYQYMNIVNIIYNDILYINIIGG